MRKKSTGENANANFCRLLVPVDFSEPSARALRHAEKLAAASGGSLIIVHVVPADYGWLRLGLDELRDLDRSLQRQAADRLRAFADEHLDHNRTADLEVRIGRPAEEILNAAIETRCDAIVLSTRGLTGIDRYLIGSVADRVAQLATCPVFLIPSGTPPIPRAATSAAVLRFKHKGKAQR